LEQIVLSGADLFTTTQGIKPVCQAVTQESIVSMESEVDLAPLPSYMGVILKVIETAKRAVSNVDYLAVARWPLRMSYQESGRDPTLCQRVGAVQMLIRT
jgi:hypothetical protein